MPVKMISTTVSYDGDVHFHSSEDNGGWYHHDGTHHAGRNLKHDHNT